MIDNLFYAKLPPKLKRSVNMARLESASYEEIVIHLERELELNGLEGGDDLPVPTKSTARELAFFHLPLIQMSPATIAKKPGMSKTTAENSNERRNKSATTGRISRRNIQNVQLATKRITRRNGVEKALEPTSGQKISSRQQFKSMRSGSAAVSLISVSRSIVKSSSADLALSSDRLFLLVFS